MLSCLRGDSAARTTLASITAVVGALPLWARHALGEPRYRLAVDESYRSGDGPAVHSAPVAVLRGTWEWPQLVFDADRMVGTDDEACAALTELGRLIAEHQVAVVLEEGDVLVVDNDAAVHGRSPFTPRFDGTDRWLQRTFVVADLGPSARDRIGRVIATEFAA